MAEVLEPLRAALAAHYRIERELGRGGMAAVYLAEDLKHRRPVAVKVLHPEITALLGPERFLREIEIAARLTHPHILPLHDSGQAGGFLYYVMPYVEGESLRERLGRERQLPLDDALSLARDVAGALDFAHRHGVVHRDIKPENILLEERHAVVADFGIARAIRAAGGDRLTETGVLLGTPAYMSPEQALGSADVDGRSDQYSLACVLYEMLAGQPPFTGGTVESLVRQHLATTPPAVTSVRSSVPAEIERALARSLAKAPADRFSTASRFAEAISSSAAAVGAPATPAGTNANATAAAPAAPTVTVAAPARASLPRSRVAIVAAGAVLAVAVLSLAFAGWRGAGPLAMLAPGRGPVDPARKDLVMVADFEGPPDDPGLATSVHDLVTAAIDQSAIVAAVSGEALANALRDAGKPEGTRIDAALARELAYRRSVRAVVEGRVSRLGKGYSIALQVVDVDSARTVLSLSEATPSQDGLIASVARLGRRLRAGLGERRSAIQPTRPLIQVTTSSFDAYRRFLKARELHNDQRDFRGAISEYRAALALDSTFAQAWAGIATALFNLGEIDSAKAANAQALRHAERLSDVSRLVIEANMARMRDDTPAAMSAYDRALRANPTPAQAASIYGNRGSLLLDAGRDEEAVESYRRAIEASPLQPSQPAIRGLVNALETAGRSEESRELFGKLKDQRERRTFEAEMAVSTADWALAESMGVALQSDPTATPFQRSVAASAAACAEAARGSVSAADDRLRRAQEMAMAGKQEEREAGQLPWRQRVVLAVFSGREVPAVYPPLAADTAAWTWVDKGFRAAAAGDTAGAQTALRHVRTLARKEDWARVPESALEGWLALRRRQWGEARERLAPACPTGDPPIGPYVESMRVWIRWLAADAFEQLGQPDSAAAVIELTLAPKHRYDWAAGPRGLCYCFARQRLVMLYAKMGRPAEARRHWDVLAETVTRPDPDVAARMDEARSALASVEAMTGQRAR